MAKDSRHVVPSPSGGWSVRKTGAAKASKNFETQEDAVQYGKALARKNSSDLYVHSKSGTVRDHMSYKK
ncbi:MAG: hypothetical protein JWO58_3367 [Chitinophagaceae bacterium]|nr:hypothetical protein [Chitinophagaceae bacterium]